MMKKVTFTMAEPDAKKHSTKFDFEGFTPDQAVSDEVAKGMKNAAFYIPKPFAEGAKRIQVTIEVVE